MTKEQLELYASLVRAQIRTTGMQAHNDWVKQNGGGLYTEQEFISVIASEGIDEASVRARLEPQ